MCVYVCMYVCMHACTHACMHACMYVCMYCKVQGGTLQLMIGEGVTNLQGSGNF